MNKQEVLKELDKLKNTKDYSQIDSMNTGYRAGVMDAIDLVKKLNVFLVKQNCKLQEIEK